MWGSRGGRLRGVVSFVFPSKRSGKEGGGSIDSGEGALSASIWTCTGFVIQVLFS